MHLRVSPLSAETPILVKAAELVVAGGAAVILVGAALGWGALPPKATDPSWWVALLWLVAAAGVCLLVWGLVMVVRQVWHVLTKTAEIQPLGLRSPIMRKVRAAPNTSPTSDVADPRKSPANTTERRIPFVGPVEPEDAEEGDVWIKTPPEHSTPAPTAPVLPLVPPLMPLLQEESTPLVGLVITQTPHSDWTGPETYRSGFIENGLGLYYCPYCAFRTTDGPEAIDAHISTAHELDPRNVADWYNDPQPWAQEPVYFIAPNKDRYISGVPADDMRTLYVSKRRADELVGTGLYVRGVAPYTWRRGADEVGTADRFGRQVRRRANADGWFIPRGAGDLALFADLTRPNKAVARDLRVLVRDLRDWLKSNQPDFEGNRPPEGATADELRRAAMFDDRVESMYRDSYRARIQPLVVALERSGLDADPDWAAMSGERIRWRDLPRLVDSLDRAATALEERPDV